MVYFWCELYLVLFKLYIQLGKPTQSAYIERFNRTARHEWLDLHLFESIGQVQLLAT